MYTRIESVMNKRGKVNREMEKKIIITYNIVHILTGETAYLFNYTIN